MGGGNWNSASFTNYSMGIGRTVTNGAVMDSLSAQQMFKSRVIDPYLNPKNVIRECCDSDEHPNTLPVILALDVTGSMGASAVEVAKKLNIIMTELYESVSDVQFMIMGIGDLYCDNYPIQATQFESDIRIAEQLDKIFFEGGGGGNGYESYTAAWYFGITHTKLDCWKRGKKGIIITIGDEPLNPYLPREALARVTGDNIEGHIDTSDLYESVAGRFNIYHLSVDTYTGQRYEPHIKSSFGRYMDDNHLRFVTLDSIASEIVQIIKNEYEKDCNVKTNVNSNMISW